MKAIITTDFDSLNSKVHQYLVDNIQGYSASKWCEKIIHPTTGDIAFTVEDKILPALTTEEKNNIITLTDDWFPTS